MAQLEKGRLVETAMPAFTVLAFLACMALVSLAVWGLLGLVLD